MHTEFVLKEETAGRAAEQWHSPSFDEGAFTEAERDDLGRNETGDKSSRHGDEWGQQHVLRGRAASRAASPHELDKVLEAAPDVFASHVPEEPDEEAKVDVEALKAEWATEWQARLDAATEEAREAGYEAGCADTQRMMEAEQAKERAATEQRVRQLQDVLDDYMEACTPLLADLAVDVAETVLQGPLPQDAQARMVEALQEAIDKLSGEHPITVSVHPVDYMLMQESGFIEQVAHAPMHVTWKTVPEWEEGDWSVESPVAVIRQLRAEAFQGLRQTLGVYNRLSPAEAEDA